MIFFIKKIGFFFI